MKNKKITKLWGGAFSKTPDEKIQAFLSARDVQGLPCADEILLPYDLEASEAHCLMLAKQGLISNAEAKKLVDGLRQIKKLYELGKFQLDPQKEDVHTNIEAFLIEKYGIEIGGKIHTGRSRNDQIVVATRLFLRASVEKFSSGLEEVINTIKNKAKLHEKDILPGYTHHRKAMPTTFSEILLSFKAMFERDKEKLQNWISVWNKNPLGAAAGFGTSFNIDRNYTAKLLKFSSVEENTIDTVTSRWEAEADFAYCICSLMNHLSFLAQTLIIFSMEEFGYVSLDESYCTGSSIMPQKKNPDVLEILKAKAGWVEGQLMSLLSIGKSNLSGYNRDTQWTKYIVVDIVRECLPALPIVEGIIKTLKVNKIKMEAATKSGKLYATAQIERLVRKKHISLRQAKMIVEKMIRENKYKEEKIIWREL